MQKAAFESASRRSWKGGRPHTRPAKYSGIGGLFAPRRTGSRSARCKTGSIGGSSCIFPRSSPGVPTPLEKAGQPGLARFTYKTPERRREERKVQLSGRRIQAGTHTQTLRATGEAEQRSNKVPSPNLRDKRSGWILEQMQRSAWLGWCKHPPPVPHFPRKNPAQNLSTLQQQLRNNGTSPHTPFLNWAHPSQPSSASGGKASYRFHLFLCWASCLASAARSEGSFQRRQELLLTPTLPRTAQSVHLGLRLPRTRSADGVAHFAKGEWSKCLEAAAFHPGGGGPRASLQGGNKPVARSSSTAPPPGDRWHILNP